MPFDYADQITMLKQIIEQQTARINEQEQTITDLRALVDDLRSLKVNLEETLEELRREIFGCSSEKTSPKSTESDAGNTPDDRKGQKINVKGYTRERHSKSSRDDLYALLPVREVKIPASDADRYCAYCNTEMEHLGYKYMREEIRITCAKVERIQYYAETLICPACRTDGDGTLVQAQIPSALIKHRLHEELLKRAAISADETTCQVLNEEGRLPEQMSYMWVYTSVNDNLPSITLYNYQPGRSGSHARDFLAGFKGLLQCDGFAGYNKVENVVLVCCLAHCRRKFYEAMPSEAKKGVKLLDINSEEEIPEPEIRLLLSSDNSRISIASKGLAYCNRLFFIERMHKELEAEDRHRERLEHEVPVWNEFWQWIDTLNPVIGSKLEKAVNYAKNHRETLMNYLLDGRCDISNNRAERRCKSYAIIRKNSLFHTSVKGAAASTVISSIVETAKSNNLNAYQYLYMVLLYMPDYKNEPAGIEALLPWSSFIKKHCSGITDTETIVSEIRPDLFEV